MLNPERKLKQRRLCSKSVADHRRTSIEDTISESLAQVEQRFIYAMAYEIVSAVDEVLQRVNATELYWLSVLSPLRRRDASRLLRATRDRLESLGTPGLVSVSIDNRQSLYAITHAFLDALIAQIPGSQRMVTHIRGCQQSEATSEWSSGCYIETPESSIAQSAESPVSVISVSSGDFPLSAVPRHIMFEFASPLSSSTQNSSTPRTSIPQNFLAKTKTLERTSLAAKVDLAEREENSLALRASGSDHVIYWQSPERVWLETSRNEAPGQGTPTARRHLLVEAQMKLPKGAMVPSEEAISGLFVFSGHGLEEETRPRSSLSVELILAETSRLVACLGNGTFTVLVPEGDLCGGEFMETLKMLLLHLRTSNQALRILIVTCSASYRLLGTAVTNNWVTFALNLGDERALIGKYQRACPAESGSNAIRGHIFDASFRRSSSIPIASGPTPFATYMRMLALRSASKCSRRGMFSSSLLNPKVLVSSHLWRVLQMLKVLGQTSVTLLDLAAQLCNKNVAQFSVPQLIQIIMSLKFIGVVWILHKSHSHRWTHPLERLHIILR